MAILYLSNEWGEAWCKSINGSKACTEGGKAWGVGWNGKFVFEVQPGSGLEETKYLYFDFSAGECHEARLIDDPSKVDPGFISSGPYGDFKKVAKGEGDFVAMTMKGTLKLKGDMSKVMGNFAFIRALADSIKAIPEEVTYLGE